MWRGQPGTINQDLPTNNTVVFSPRQRGNEEAHFLARVISFSAPQFMSSPPRSSPLSPRHRSIPLQQSDSSSSSAPRVSSPLNPASQSSASDDITFSPTSTSDDEEEEDEGDYGPPSFGFKSRGQSSSSVHRHTHSNPSIIIDAGNGGQDTPGGSARSLPLTIRSLSSELTMSNDNRGRSLAPGNPFGKSRESSPAPSATLDASWWGDHEKSVLPWKEAQPKRKHSIPAEQLEGLEHTKQVSPFRL